MPRVTVYKSDETARLLEKMPDVRPSRIFEKAVREEATERGLIAPVKDD